MPPDDTKFSAVVLVGGRSSRMGRHKAMLPFGGKTLIERLIAELRRVSDDIVVVAAPESVPEARLPPLDVRVVRDEVAFAGPAQALLAGLRSIRREVAFACGSDLPMLGAQLAAQLCSMLEESDDAIIPVVAERPQVLHAVYRKRCTGAIETMLASGNRRLYTIGQLVKVRRVEEIELRRLDPELRSFFNLNTPADYAAALGLIEPER